MTLDDNDNSLVLAGIWNQKVFDDIVAEFANIKDELEDLFRTVVET